MNPIKLLFAASLTMFVTIGFVYGQDTTLTVTNGNVGIGMTNPTQKLVVEGDMRVTGSSRMMLGGPFSSEYIYNPTGNSLRIHVGNDDRIAISNGGNVGVGTASPGSKLDVHGTGTTRFDLRTSSTTDPVFHRFFHSPNIQGGAVGFDTDDNILKLVHGGNFDTSTNGLTIGSDGNVGIGTISLNRALHVVGNVRFEGFVQIPDFEGLYWGGGATRIVGDEVFKRIIMYTAGSERMRIDGVGNVGIGTMAPTHPLEMASGAHVTTGGVWTDASSRQYKENISNLTQEEAISALEKLNPVKFNYKVQKDEDYVGFIAEDVPDLVATGDRKSLSSMDIVAVLTKVVQQQQKQIAELEARLNAGQ